MAVLLNGWGDRSFDHVVGVDSQVADANNPMASQVQFAIAGKR